MAPISAGIGASCVRLARCPRAGSAIFGRASTRHARRPSRRTSLRSAFRPSAAPLDVGARGHQFTRRRDPLTNSRYNRFAALRVSPRYAPADPPKPIPQTIDGFSVPV
ncbi:hypothetical protein NFA_44460 [Nocardia farcinica IFM 10152]|uniref:Uncharacterized protein n=1 Tax=Nocardia farcinica (strain IFM 10152) TaxID=247156 RepID=Q5YR94_NOCFA|nr:hypothetical protein NFA_44460 [Nocardia farcinica IFM 10152]